MEIYRSGNGGKPTIDAGSLKRVNSYNVGPSTIVATASAGTTFDRNLIDNYEFFNVAQTSAGTDLIVLPDTLPVGTEIRFQAASAISIGVPDGSSVTINNVAGPAVLALAADATAVITKVSSTRIVVQQIASTGAVTAPTPA